MTNEIIVVDNGSTDNTVEILNTYRCKVIESPNTQIDEGRNLYLEECRKRKQPWIFVLDADERIDIQRVKELKSYLGILGNDIVRIGLPIYNFIGEGRWVETMTYNRLFRNRDYIKYNNVIMHASIAKSSKERKEEKGRVIFPIFHLGVLENPKNEKKDSYILII